jgi:hypothetical protein
VPKSRGDELVARNVIERLEHRQVANPLPLELLDQPTPRAAELTD